MDVLQTVIGIVALLFILVGVHEFGHFFVARRCGVRVLRFCIGMGTPIWSFKDRQGTEFGIAPFPLGGYVKMLDEREGDVDEKDYAQCYNRKTVWQRIAILSAGPLANFLLAFAVFAVLAISQGQIGAAAVIGSVTPNSMADIAGLEQGQEIRSIDGAPTPTTQDVLERLLMRLGETGTLELTVARPESDLEYEIDVPLQGWLKGEAEPNPLEGLGIRFFRPQLSISQVLPDSAASEAGLREGDTITGIDGHEIESASWWVAYVKQRPEERLNLAIEREGRVVQIPVTPRAVTTEEGETLGQIGVAVGSSWPSEMIRERHFGPVEAIAFGAARTWDTSVFVLVSMKKLVLGQISTKNLSGPIGIAKVAGDRAKAGLVYFVEFLALLSISLGVLNLLPIPILDGGQILYCLIEGIKGGPLPERIQLWGYSAGLAMLACVMVLALYNDILRL